MPAMKGESERIEDSGPEDPRALGDVLKTYALRKLIIYNFFLFIVLHVYG